MPAVDKTQSGLGAPADEWVPITPSDSTDLTYIPRALYIGTAGALKAVDGTGTARTMANAVAGYHPLRPRRIYSTGTTATDIWALY
jgi:hypothetical protein